MPRACAPSGPAHYGPGTYAQGTDATRRTRRARPRIAPKWSGSASSSTRRISATRAFGRRSISFTARSGPATPTAARSCRINRQFTDEQIKALIERGARHRRGLDAWMMVPGWIRGKSTPEAAGVKLETAGRSHRPHLPARRQRAPRGIGTDLDGAFGREQSPRTRHHRRSVAASGAACGPRLRPPSIRGYCPRQLHQVPARGAEIDRSRSAAGCSRLAVAGPNSRGRLGNSEQRPPSPKATARSTGALRAKAEAASSRTTERPNYRATERPPSIHPRQLRPHVTPAAPSARRRARGSRYRRRRSAGRASSA